MPLKFGEALEIMKRGRKVKRQKWSLENDQPNYIYIAPAYEYEHVPTNESSHFPPGYKLNKSISIDFYKTSDDGNQIGKYIFSDLDIVEEDWVEVI